MLITVRNNRSKEERSFELDQASEEIIEKYDIAQCTINKICYGRKDSAEIKVVFQQFDELNNSFTKKQAIEIMKSDTGVSGNINFLKNNLDKIQQLGFSNTQISRILGKNGGYKYLEKVVSETNFFNQDDATKTKKAHAAYALVFHILVHGRCSYLQALKKAKNNDYEILLRIVNSGLKDDKITHVELSEWMGNLKKITTENSRDENSTFYTAELTPATPSSIQQRAIRKHNRAKNKSSTIDSSNSTSSSSSYIANSASSQLPINSGLTQYKARIIKGTLNDICEALKEFKEIPESQQRDNIEDNQNIDQGHRSAKRPRR